ncbi:MAG: hypothetical protein MUC48_20905 [Leptolyngbya sp. Prado105]|jgi:hypothetical protein|nr:hypothetical protein [Leptolyngbya sp. Prado105]
MSDWAETVREVWSNKVAYDYKAQAEDVQTFLANPAITLNLNDEEERSMIPQSVLDAYDYYVAEVEAADWGTVSATIEKIQNQEVLAITVTTDGSDGWVELFDLEGKQLGAARTLEEWTAWGNINEIRAFTQTSDLPQDLKAKQSSESV